MNRCPRCTRGIPADAVFCIHCAAPLQAAPPLRSQEPATGATIRLNPSPTNVPIRPFRRARSAPRRRQQHRRNQHPHTVGPVFLIGILFLLATRTFWPGILVLLGLMHFVRASSSGRPDRTLKQFVFLAGMALLFWSGLFWPGILLLMFVSHLLSGARYGWRP